jgi:hypothetical protein
MSALLLSIGCTAESSRAPAPAAPLAADTVAATRSASISLGRTAVAFTGVICTPLPIPVVSTAPADSNAHSRPAVDVDSAERLAFTTAEGRVSRDSTELRIRLLDGRTTTFEDNKIPQRFLLHRYVGYLKAIHSHVVHGYPMEGNGYHLIVDDSTGDSTIVYGMPVPSPDGTRFVLTSMIGEARYDPGLVEVWRMVGRTAVNEFSLDTEDAPWEPSDAVWRDSVTIDFMKNRHSSPGDPYVQTPGCLSRSGTTWVLSDSSPQK